VRPFRRGAALIFRRSGAALPMALLLLSGQAAGARARTPSPRGPFLVLSSPRTGERTVAVPDLRFAYFQRTYYEKRAPRSEDPSGRRLEVKDRRRECRCLRLQDWSRISFGDLRQIEIRFPPGGQAARLRLTWRPGKVREISAATLYGAAGPLPPRLVATIEGGIREFPLVLNEPGAAWPEEIPIRIQLLPPPPPAR
jgi:hypothetical protein